jgi:hypothetical protein
MSGLITPEQMAERLHDVPVATVLEWNRKLGWPHVRVGHRIRWTEDQYAEIVRRQSVTPADPKGLPGQTARSAARRRSA